MSTTDSIRDAFEAHWPNAAKERDGDTYDSTIWECRWEGWKAASEAAKATGTAGDLPELPQCFGSIDVYHDSGQVTSVDGWTADQIRGYAIDYVMQLGLAARQPAPVADNDAFKEAYMIWSRKTDWVQEQISSFPPSALGKHRADVMREEIERLRAALAATAAPVLSDEQILQIARANSPANGNYSIFHIPYTSIIKTVRAILAATRSQP